MSAASTAERAAAVRRFNRFYTRRIGVLGRKLLESRFSLTEARVLYEIASRRERVTAGAIAADLSVDTGYMSRIVSRFERSGLLRREPSPIDARQRVLDLTRAGRDAFEELSEASQQAFESLLAAIAEPDQERLLAAMGTITAVLDDGAAVRPPIIIRPHRLGDIGRITHLHAVLYEQEFGWDASFEALVAEILAAFVNNYDPQRERSWIAETDGEIVGSVFLVRQDDRVAKLRLLLVHPRARGRGLGRRLVDECIRFARAAGYERLTLYTNDVLRAARRIYDHAGFRPVEEWAHHSFGRDLVGQTLELDLRSVRDR